MRWNGASALQLFLPSPAQPAYHNASFVQTLERNSGRDDVEVRSMWAMSNDFEAGVWGFFASCRAPGPPPPPPPTGILTCPVGEKLDVVAAPGDNGSCDCDTFCASDWAGVVKATRPDWSGATSAVPNASTDCQYVPNKKRTTLEPMCSNLNGPRQCPLPCNGRCGALRVQMCASDSLL